MKCPREKVLTMCDDYFGHFLSADRREYDTEKQNINI